MCLVMPEKKQPNKEEKNSLKPEKEESEELNNLKDSMQRLQAEFENSRKRLEREKQEFALFANTELIKKLLPLLDSIEAAKEHFEKQENFSGKDCANGLELIKKQLLEILISEGLKRTKAVGKKFDPLLHDAVTEDCEEEKENEIVLEEFQKGYTLKEKLLRPAKVKINKSKKSL